MCGVTITLARGMGEPTYRLPQIYRRPVLVGRLGGFFGGRRFCIEAGLCCCGFWFVCETVDTILPQYQW